MTINETVMPIQLPTQAHAHWLDGSTGTNVRVCGWGKVQVRPAVYPDLLHCVEVPLVDSVTCNSAQVRQQNHYCQVGNYHNVLP